MDTERHVTQLILSHETQDRVASPTIAPCPHRLPVLETVTLPAAWSWLWLNRVPRSLSRSQCSVSPSLTLATTCTSYSTQSRSLPLSLPPPVSPPTT